MKSAPKNRHYMFTPEDITIVAAAMEDGLGYRKIFAKYVSLRFLGMRGRAAKVGEGGER